MKYFMDTEFIEDGKTIDLLSIGIVKEDGTTYYAESNECKLEFASDWVRKNVFPNLRPTCARSRNTIKTDILHLVKNDKDIEFWGYYSDYDWVVFCQLFGKMIDLPEGFPMFCLDLKQEMYQLNYKKEDLIITTNNQEHNALADAIEIKNLYFELQRLTK